MNSQDIQKDPWCSSIQHSYTLWTAVKTVPRHHMGIQLLANWKSIQSVLTCSPIASRKPTSTLNIPNRPPGQKLGPQTEKMCFKRSTNLGILHHHQGKSMQHRKKGSKLLRAVWFSLPRKWYSAISPRNVAFLQQLHFLQILPKIPNDSTENFQVPQFGKKLMVTPYLAVIFAPLLPISGPPNCQGSPSESQMFGQGRAGQSQHTLSAGAPSIQTSSQFTAGDEVWSCHGNSQPWNLNESQRSAIQIWTWGFCKASNI